MKEIGSGIKVRKNSIISIKNNRLRNREVKLQIKEDLLKWKIKRNTVIVDCQKCLFIDIENVWSICICYSVSKYGKLDDDNNIIYNLFRRI